MSFHSLLADALAWWARSFDRAISREAAERAEGNQARGEFISTLIIDHGATGWGADGKAPGRRLFD